MSEKKLPAALFGAALRKNKRNKKAANFSKKSETASNVSSHATVDSNNDLDVAVTTTVDLINESSVVFIQASMRSIGSGTSSDVGANVPQIESKSVPFIEPIGPIEAFVPNMHAFNVQSHIIVESINDVPATVDACNESSVAVTALMGPLGSIIQADKGHAIDESNNDFGVVVPATVDARIKSSVAVPTAVDAKHESGVALPATVDTNNASGVVDVPVSGKSIGSDASVGLHVPAVECTVLIDPIIEAHVSNGSPISVGSPFLGFSPLSLEGCQLSSDEEPFFGFSPQKERKSIAGTVSPLMKKIKFHDIESDSPKEGSSKMIAGIVEHEITTIFGDFCQHDMASIACSNFQCSGMAVCALLYCTVKLITDWDSSDLNKILNIGHEFYKNSLMHAQEQSEDVKFVNLKPYKLLQQMKINDRCYNIHVRDSSYWGSLEKNHLFDALEYLNVLQINYAILIIDNMSYGLIIYRIADTITYVLFDSHGRDYEIKRSRRYSAIIFFYNADSLIQLLLYDFQYASNLEIIPVNFEIAMEVVVEDQSMFSKMRIGEFCQYNYGSHEQSPYVCCGISMVALLYSKHTLVNIWDASDLNKIINLGMDFYSFSMFHHDSLYADCTNYLNPDQLVDQLTIDDKCYDIIMQDIEYSGGIETQHLLNAFKYLNNLEMTFAILVIDRLSYGVIVCRSENSLSYVLYDSHGRTVKGERFGQYSAILFFDDVTSIAKFLALEFKNNSGFDLYPINFRFAFSCKNSSICSKEIPMRISACPTPQHVLIEGKHFYKIVFGSFSQSWSVFTEPYTQCTAMAAVALAYVLIRPVELWNDNVLDDVLWTGQIFYEHCLRHLRSVDATINSTYLEVFELLQKLDIGNRSFHLNIVKDECIGSVHDSRHNFSTAINRFEQNGFSFGIITFKGYSFGLIRSQGQPSSYVFFDSHGRNDDGVRPGEKSAILFFNNADDFIDFFLEEFPLLGAPRPNESELGRTVLLVPLLITEDCNENSNVDCARFTKVVSGSFAQNDNRFDVRSRNCQCTANSVVFLAFASVLKGKWTDLDVDRILMLGDHIYVVSYEVATKNQPRSHPFLAAHEIVQRILVTVSRLDCGVVSAICKPLTEKEFSGNFGKFALRYIERFFVNYTSGVFICSSLSVALHRSEDQYIIFDPHARNVDGTKQSDGTANIFIFPNIQSLLEFISQYGGYNTALEFTLTPFDISHENDVNERVKVRGAPMRNLITDGDDFYSDDDDIPLPQSPEWDNDDYIPLKKLIKPTVVIPDDMEIDSGSEAVVISNDVEIDSGSDAESVTSFRSMPVPKSKPMFLEFSASHVEREWKKVKKFRSKAIYGRSHYKASLNSEEEQKLHKRWRAYLEKCRYTHTPRVFMTKKEFKDFLKNPLNDGCDDEIVKATDIAVANLLRIEENRRLRMLNTNNWSKHFQAFGNHENIDESNKIYELHTLSLMNQVCEFCGAKYFNEERTKIKKQFTICCNLGEIHSELREKLAMNYPHQLKTLLLRESPLSGEFLQNILLYNNVLSFASMGTTDFRHLSASGSIGPVVAVQGMIYHIAEHFRTNSTGDGMPTAQLYYVDTSSAVDERLRRTNVTLNRSLLIQLEVLMRTINPFTDAYRMLSEVLNEVRRRPNGNATEVHLQIVRNRNAIQIRQNHGGDFGLPTSNEVAAVFTERPDPRTKNLVIFPVDKPAEDGISIHSTDPNRDAMMYPLLFPNGEQTWSYNLFRRKKETEKKVRKEEEKDEDEDTTEAEEETDEEEVRDRPKTKKRARITLREFFCFMFMICNAFSPILNAGKLSQQYIIDAYSRCQENTFEYIESPRGQAQIRADTYGALMDYIEKKKVFQPDIPGKLIVMPMHIDGSRQYMKEKYSDAMAMVTRFGKPTFFLTMTCNPMWEDIRKNLPKNANPIDHPGIVARVFRAKQQAFIKDLQENHVMGKFVAYVSVVEWQKRSLPHCHLMLWTTEEDKPANALDIDSFVSAEIPDQKKNPRLYKAVTSFMYHHRCDTANNVSCLRPKKNGKGNECSKHFPRQFAEQSKLVEGSYPIYRRRENGRTFMSVRGQEIDNKWIVPYNPYLLLKYNCHLNVEIVSSLKSLKYLFKYFHKGLDMARLRVEIIDNVQVFNEFAHYVDSRYLSSGEAIWKIYGFPVFQKSHAVYALPVHLEHYQRVIFNVDNPEAALDRSESRLTAFFKLNQTDPVARQYLYTDIPYHYVFNEKKRIWTKRQRGQVVTRIHLVNYNNIELYSLRMLLYVVKGPQSYEDIRKVNGLQYDTFREAAIALGLLEDDSLTIETFKEIMHIELPNRIRSLFAQMLLWCTPTDPLAIWNEFKKYMYEDYVHKKFSPELSENLALKDISYFLRAEGKSNTFYKLPEPILSSEDLKKAQATNVPVKDARTFDRAQEENDGKELSGLLNSDQRCIFDTIMDSVHNRNAPDQQKLFFVDGPGGTGKTFLFSALISSIRGLGLNVLPVAWTGIAAILMKGGKTAHSSFKLPYNITGKFTCDIYKGSDYANELCKVDVIIWDEISMTLSHAVNAVDDLFRFLMGNELPFGGKIFCCTGDFRQILPIVPGGSKADILAVLVKKSKVWPLLQKHALTVNVRLTDSNDLAFARWQLDIGEGKLKDYPANEYYNGYVKIPAENIEPNSIVDRIYGKTFKSSDVIEKYSNTAIITTLNEDVEFLNKAIYSRMTEDVPTEKCYLSSDKVIGIEADDDDAYDVKMLNSLKPSNMAPHELKLKENCLITLLRNVNLSQGLCNGTRLIVTKLYKTCIRAKILTGDFKGEEVLLSRYRMTSKTVDTSGELERVQFPVQISFGQTFNKAQGQTYDTTGVYLRKPPFAHGHLFVAMSRGRTKGNLIVQVLPGPFMGKLKTKCDDVFVPNIVYKEVL